MRKTRFLLAPLAAAVLAACAVGPNYHAPETKAAEKFDSLESTYSADQGNARSSGRPSPTPSSTSS